MRLVVVLLLSMASCALAAEDYLDNGVIKLGIELTKGGSITYLSISGTTNNIVNDHDLGRQIQQAYYSGPQPYNPSNNVNPVWTNWPWNPIQSGDSYGNPSTVLASTNDGQTLYVKCRPMQWALDNVPGQCTFESWITLTGNVAVVSNRLVNMRTDTTQQFAALNQELPAVYTVGSLYRLFSYAGNAPFTSDVVTNLPTAPSPYWQATESWAALVDTNSWGLGVYHPGVVWFAAGFNGIPGSGGPADDPTGYVSPMRFEVLDSNIAYTYTYHLILGTLSQIRAWVYARPYRPACNFVFDSDRQHWTYLETTDAGWPLTNHRVRVSLNSSDPQMWSPPCAFAAAGAPKLYIRAAYQIAHPAGRATGQLFWATNGAGFSEPRSAIFPVVADGQFHTYELNLAASTNYTGLITQLRFDPAFNGESDDSVDVQAISSSPFAGNNTVAPTLNVKQTDGKVVVSFPAVSGTTAGFVSNNLLYDLESRTDLTTGSWQGVSGYTNLLGDNTAKSFTNLPSNPAKLYRVAVRLQ